MQPEPAPVAEPAYVQPEPTPAAEPVYVQPEPTRAAEPAYTPSKTTYTGTVNDDGTIPAMKSGEVF